MPWLAYIRDDEEKAGGANQIIRLSVSEGELQRFGGGVGDLQGLPVELDEAAEIDGCSKVGIFFRIILPLIKPALITAAIFSFFWTWNDFLRPLVYLNHPRLYTVSIALRSFADPTSSTDWGPVFAMMFLSLVPVSVVFIAFQRYLVEGISTSGLTG